MQRRDTARVRSPARRTWLAGALIVAAAVAGGAPDAVAAGAGADVTARYAALAHDGKLDPVRVERAFAGVVAELRQYRILVVPSWLTDTLIAASDYGLTDYFRSPLEALRAHGITADIADVDTEATVAANGRRLADIVAASDRPVCLVTHSKGGLDALEFLVRADAATRRRLVCWVALQAPFFGSPVADVVADEDFLRLITDPALRALGGSGASLDDLTTGVRAAYTRRHAAPVARAVATLPTLSVATVLDDAGGPVLPSIHMMPSYWLMKRRGLANDGLVPLDSTILPGAAHLVLGGLDHTDTIADKPILGDPIDRSLLLKALLYLVLSEGRA